KALAKKLRLKHFSAGDFFKKKAAEAGLKEKETKRAAKFLKSSAGSSREFHISIDELQKELARQGNIVIDSKLGIRMLSGLYDVSVWLKASAEARAKRVSKRDKIPIEEAAKTVKEKDRLERESFMRIYGFDTFSQEQSADIVVDTSDKTPWQIVELIINGMKDKGEH
ncbi:MAG: cytidylate kinase family protein, partial [Candidatus Aenigmarchaeota archaeon]|nr:cytidylate kinase family protein [Candidatus Aenigmarchaeota archaeon]